MEKTSKIYAGLIVLTILSVVAAYYTNFIAVIMILAALKFMGVSFYFMELHKAHLFWKVGLLLFLALFIGLILLSVAN